MSTFQFSSQPNKPRRKNIFISYRERDTAGETGRLVDSLKQYFYEDQVFLDIDKIEPGVDFTDVISKSLESCDVMLAVIGPNWAAKNADGKARIKDPNDWVRLEIATALQRNIRVVPVLVDGASLPSSDELPDDLQPLLRRQAYEISNKRWKYDTDQLVGFLEKSVGIPTRQIYTPPKPSQSSGLANGIKWLLIIAGALFIILLVLYVVNNKQEPLPKTDNDSIVKDKRAILPADDTTGRPTEKEEKPPAPQPVIEIENVEGTWDDANGLYYLVISQNGNQLEVTSYSVVGQKTGEGLGTVNGRDCSFKINVINVGILSAKTKISSDESTLQGSLNIENNGAVYSEPLVLRRR